MGALHGRDAERAALASARGGLVVVGPPGSGRTALLRDAAAGATRPVYWVTGTPQEHDLPLAGLHALLHRRPGPLPPVLGDALDTGTSPPGLALGRAVLTAVGDAVCCVDDADLLDPVSLRALGFAARRGATVLGSSAAGGHGLPELRIGGLAEAACRALVADLAGRPVPEQTHRELWALSHGLPQVLAELVPALTPGQLAGTEPLPPGPPRDGRAWRQRAAGLAALPGGTRAALLLVAAEPRLRQDVLLRAVDAAVLEPAERAGLLALTMGAAHLTDPLLAHVAYHGATLYERRTAHRRLAVLLDHDTDALRRAWHRAAALDGPADRLAADLAAAPGRPAEVSLALERAAALTGDAAIRAERLVAAARSAWMAGRPRRARMLLEGVATPAALPVRGSLELRGGVPGQAADELLAAAEQLLDRDREEAVRTLLRAGEASHLAGDHRRYLALARRAEALHRADDPPSLRLMFEYLAGMAASFQGRHAAAAGPLRRVLELAPAAARPALLVWAGVAGLMLGEDTRALALTGRALAAARTGGVVSVVPQVMDFLVQTETWMGDHTAAAAHALEGLRVAEESGQPASAAQHLASLALAAAVQGDADTCRVRSAAAHRLAARHRVGFAQARADWAMALLDLAEGRAERAVARLRSGHLVVQVSATPVLVEAAVRTGAVAQARAALAVFERWAASTASPDRLALAARCRALLAPPGEAAAHFHTALDLHQQGNSDFERARTQLLLGGSLRRTRHRRAAREHLHGALETFDRLGAAPWADGARHELRAAGDPTRPAAPAAELTDQQLRIARLAAEGATNREIAARLYLSHRTVEHHLGRIFTRLGIRSRVDLTRLMG